MLPFRTNSRYHDRVLNSQKLSQPTPTWRQPATATTQLILPPCFPLSLPSQPTRHPYHSRDLLHAPLMPTGQACWFAVTSTPATYYIWPASTWFVSGTDLQNHCVKQSRLPHIDTRDIIGCFKHGRYESAQVWKRLESYLSHYSDRNESIILSDEAFARMIVTGGDGADNRELLHRLVDKYYPGRMWVVILYRRYFEWFLCW